MRSGSAVMDRNGFYFGQPARVVPYLGCLSHISKLDCGAQDTGGMRGGRVVFRA